MSGKVIMRLNTDLYEEPTQSDLDEAKAFVRQRNNYASLLESMILQILRDAAKEITEICYKYNIDGTEFTLQSNPQMYSEVQAVMDRIFDEIMELIQNYSTMAATTEDEKEHLLQYVMALGRENKNLNDTLEEYLWRYLYDLEALIASMKVAEYGVTDASAKIVGALQSVYATPEVRNAFSVPGIAAMYLKSKGVHYHRGTHIATVGLSNSGAVNVVNMAKITLAMAWNRYQATEFEEEGAIGYYQLRGSNYPCHTCDDQVGFHRGIVDIFAKPLVHPHCCCYRVPIFQKQAEEIFGQ